MKKKLLAFGAMLIILAGAVITPTFTAVSGNIHLQTAYAAEIGSTTNKPLSPDQAISCGINFICSLAVGFSQLLMYMPNLLATVAGLVMDFSIWYSIQSSTYTQYDGTPEDEGVVVKGWKLVRDFTNLVFIFALFVIAFTLILNLDERKDGAPLGLDPKRTIARVLIMAVLINFSFFLGRTVIDITNILGQAFYNRIASSYQATTGSTVAASATGNPKTFYDNALGIRSISTNIISKSNPQSFLLTDALDVWKNGSTWSKYTMLYFMTAMSFFFNLFLIYIFGMIAILFFGRTMGLYLAIIISPLAFVSYTVPFLKKQAYIGFDDWMRQFLGLAFMAPIFLFFLYITVQFFSINALGKGSGWLAVAAQVLVKIGLIGFLLVYSKNLAKDLSGKAGEMVTAGIGALVSGGAMALSGGAFAVGAVRSAGIGGAARLGYRAASNKVGEVMGDATQFTGRKVFGDKKFDAMNDQWKKAGGMKIFDRKGGSFVNAGMRVLTAGSEPGIGTAWKSGKTFARRVDFEEAKKVKAKIDAEEKYKKSWEKYVGDGTPEGAKRAAEARKRLTDIDKELDQLKKDKDENIVSNEEYKEKSKKLNEEKRAYGVTDDTQRQAKIAELKANQAKRDQTEGEKKANKTVTDALKGIKEAANATTDAEKKIANARARQIRAEGELLQKKQDILNEEQAAAARLPNLENARNQALANKQDAATKLADIDRQIASTPAGSTQLAALNQQRTALENAKQVADNAYNLAENNVAQNNLTLNNLRADEARLIAEKDQYAADEAAAKDAKDRAAEKRDENEANKAAAEKIKSDIKAEKDAGNQKIKDLEAAAKDARSYADSSKKEAELRREIRQRVEPPKFDSDNITRNEKAVKDLQDKLKTIIEGKPKPPTP